jgi:hypothetical protein
LLHHFSLNRVIEFPLQSRHWRAWIGTLLG